MCHGSLTRYTNNFKSIKDDQKLVEIIELLKRYA